MTRLWKLDCRQHLRRTARRRPCRFDIGVAEELPYDNETFDVYASSFFFHHLNLEDKLKALKEAHRVLKPWGKCCIVDVDTPTNLVGKISAFGGAWLFRQPELRENIEGKLVPLFAEAGFKDLKRCAHNLGYITTFQMFKQ
jgi:ubiquinone/menaquinone biosynthesis C-methylase UbiE